MMTIPEVGTLSRPPRVLVAEDDDGIRIALEELLGHAGYEVRSVMDGYQLAAALSGADGSPSPDVVITDLRMPVVDGATVLEVVGPHIDRTVAIVISAFGDEETEERVRRAGAVFLPKPIDLDHLEEVVRRGLLEGAPAWG